MTIKTGLDQNREYERRLSVFLIVIIVLFAILILRMARLQLVQGDRFDTLAQGNRLRPIRIAAPRGIIYDRLGRILVTSRPSFSISLIPGDPDVTRDTITKVADLLSIDRTEIEKRLEKSGPLFEPVKIMRDVPAEVVTSIEERRHDLPGISIEVEPIRDYLRGSVSSHILGYVNEISKSQLESPEFKGYPLGSIVGQSGVELYYEEVLRGRDGFRQVEVDSLGRLSRILDTTEEPVPGNNIMLTIDSQLQELAENALATQMERLRSDPVQPFPNASSGAVVVLDVRSGEVLAMVSIPDFDPNEFPRGISQTRLEELLNDRAFYNRAISGTYAPGSTFKMVTALAALKEGKVTLTETVKDQGFHWLVPSLRCWNLGGHGSVDLVKALKVSCNVYFYEMGRRLGVDAISECAYALGLGRKLGIDLNGESEGVLATSRFKKEMYERRLVPEPQVLMAEHMISGMGQGFHSYTPLQMASYVATLANGGTLYRPHLLKEATDTNGNLIMKVTPEALDHVNAEQADFEPVARGMYEVTQPGGTAYGSFYDFPVEVAGKTGTAENPHGDDHAWFVCYAPVKQPEVAVVILIEQGGHGGSAAAPVARDILAGYFGVTSPASP